MTTVTTRVISIGQTIQPLASSSDQAMDLDSDTEEDVPMKAKASSEHKARRVTPKSRERVGVKSLDLRRPVRPVDRQKMCPWLRNHLDSGSVFGLSWLKKEEGIFQVSWRHASRLEWSLETDGDVFEKWARHTGIYKDGDEPEPKRWKANFRCAMHSLPDVIELTNPLERRGRNANRTYRFLKPSEVGTAVKRKANQTPVPTPRRREHSASEVSEDSGSQHADSDETETERTTDDDGQYREIIVLAQSDHDYAVRIEQIGKNSPTKILKEHGSGYVLINTESVPNVPTTVEEVLDNSQLSVGRRQSEITSLSSTSTNADKKTLYLKKRKDIRGKRAGVSKITKPKEIKRNLVINSRLKDLLARKTAAGTKTLTGVEEARQTNLGNRTSENGEKTMESQTASPSQAHGFAALLKAADIARMDTITSVADYTMTPSSSAAQAGSGVSVPSLVPSAPITVNRAVAAHTVFQEPSSSLVPSLTTVAPVSTSAATPAFWSQSETTVFPPPTSTAVPASLVFSLIPSQYSLTSLQNVSASPVCSTSSAGSSGMLPTTSAVQMEDGSPLSTSASHVIQQISDIHPEASAANFSDSLQISCPNNWNDLFKSAVEMTRQFQNASPAVPSTNGGSFTVSVTSQNSSIVTSVESCSGQSSATESAVTEVKSETSFSSVTAVKTEKKVQDEETVCKMMKACEQDSSQEASSLKLKLEKDEFPCKQEGSVKDHLENKPSSDSEITASFPAVSLTPPQTLFSAPSNHNSELLQSNDRLQVGESCSSQVSVALPSTASLSLQALNSGSQASAHSAQIANVQPVSLVLTVPQMSLSQQEQTSITLPLVGNLREILSLFAATGTATLTNTDTNSNNQ